jgi:hydrogenase maturation protease
VALDLHGMNPAQVLRAVSAFGGIVRQLLIVGCEPSPQTASDDEFPEMCPAVQSAIGEAVEMVERLVKAQLTRFESVSTLEHP